MTLFELTLALAISSGTSILLVGLGEMLAEKVGVLNIGLEGIMLMGAAGGFIVGVQTGNPVVALVAAAAAGTLVLTLAGGHGGPRPAGRTMVPVAAGTPLRATVTLTGTVSSYRGHAEIKLSDPSELVAGN